MVKKGSSQGIKTLATEDKPPFRRFFCHNCDQEVIICIDCDRRQRTCQSCKNKLLRNKNKRANCKYRNSANGKRVRAACASRRRKRLKERELNLGSCKIVGDPPTQSAQVLSNQEMVEMPIRHFPNERNNSLRKEGDKNDHLEKTENSDQKVHILEIRLDYRKVLLSG